MSRFVPSAARSLDSFTSLVIDLVKDGFRFLRLTIRSHTALSAEILFLRKQLAYYEERRTRPRRLSDSARFSLALWSRLFNWKETLVIVKPETLIGWHRKGFKLFWKWKSQVGRPRLPENIRRLIVRMVLENPTWGQARVAAELSVKLGIYVSPHWAEGAAHAGASAPGECLLRKVGGNSASRVLGFHDSAERETPGQNPGGVGHSLQSRAPSFEPGTRNS